MAEEVDAGYRGQVKPESMVISPQDKIDLNEPVAPVTEIGAPGDPRMPSQMMVETPIYGTETPYRKTPPTNIGSVAEAGFTKTPPAANVSNYGTTIVPPDYGPRVTPPTPVADAAAAASPVCTVLPTITGTVAVGQVLTCGTGTWSPAAASYTYQWFRGDTPITPAGAGATTNTRTLAAADQGYRMSCRVTGIHATLGGSSFVYTAQTIVVP